MTVSGSLFLWKNHKLLHRYSIIFRGNEVIKKVIQKIKADTLSDFTIDKSVKIFQKYFSSLEKCFFVCIIFIKPV